MPVIRKNSIVGETSVVFSCFRKRFGMIFALFSALMVFNGCVFLVGAGLGALGGYIASPDTVEGIISDREIEEVWSATVEIVTIMGAIIERDDSVNTLLADVQGTKVDILAMSLGTNAVRIRVKARRNLLPKIKVAQDVYIKIANHLLN